MSEPRWQHQNQGQPPPGQQSMPGPTPAQQPVPNASLPQFQEPQTQATPVRAPHADQPLAQHQGFASASHHRPTGPETTPPAPLPQATIWADTDQLTSDWDPPRWHDHFGFGAKVGATVLAMALLAGVLFAAGAFKRESTVRAVDWRTPAVTGPVELTFHSATFEKFSTRNLISIEASCRLVHPTATRVQSLDVRQGISARIAPGQEVTYQDRYFEFSNSGYSSLGRDELAPGVGPVPCRLQLTVPRNFQPQSHVQLFIFTQTWSDRDAAQTGGPGWRVGRGGVTMAVPVVALKEPER